MAKFLRDLLGAEEPLFSLTITQLEKAAGSEGIDVRLMADIVHKAHHVMTELGLDSKDTTPKELYEALNAYIIKSHTYDLLLDTDFVLYSLDEQIISFNLIDIIENAHHRLVFEQRSRSHGQRALRSELVQRYINHPRTDQNVIETHAVEAGLLRESDKWYDNHRTPIKNTKSEDKHMKPYVLAIGDIITSSYIKLSEDYARVETDEKGYQRLSLELGAKLPYDRVDTVRAVECSPNAAVSISRLGIKAGLMAWLGDDEVGSQMVDYLKSQEVDTDELAIEKGMKSSHHYVLRYGVDRTKLQRFEDYSYEWHEPARKPDWVYLGVLGEKTWPLHEALLNYLKQNPDVKLVFQPGMYHLIWGVEKMAPFYKRAELVVMNREEAAQVTGKDRSDIAELIQSLHELGVRVAVVTDGAEGAYASEGEEILFMKNYPDVAPPFDRTGAGDAFASTMAAALILGESLETALRWAPINSMSVVQKLGAQEGLLDLEAIQKYLDQAPDWYQPKKFEGEG